MIFEFRCIKCNHVNSWTIYTVNISEYSCQECHVPIGYSNGKMIKLYEAVAMNDNNRYRVYEESLHVHGFGYAEPTQFYYSTTSGTSSTDGYWYPAGHIF